MDTTIAEVADLMGRDIWTASPFGLLVFAVVIVLGYRRVAK